MNLRARMGMAASTGHCRHGPVFRRVSGPAAAPGVRKLVKGTVTVAGPAVDGPHAARARR